MPSDARLLVPKDGRLLVPSAEPLLVAAEAQLLVPKVRRLPLKALCLVGERVAIADDDSDELC